MSWDVELQRKLRKNLLLLDNCAAHPHSDSVRISGWDFSLQHHIPAAANGRGNHKENLKALYRAKLVNCILQAIQENLLTSSSAAQEVSARIDLLLQQYSLLPTAGEELSTKAIQNCFTHCF
jgi:hypothetical protein